MNKPLAFVGLDFNLMKPYSKGIIFLSAMGLVFGYFTKSTSILSSFMMMMLVLVMSYPFAVGDKNGLDTLYGTLSLSRKNIVAGRYLFVLTLETVFLALTLLCSWLLSIVISTDFILSNEFFTLSMLSALFSLVVAIQYPIHFKYGYNKAKGIAYIPLLAVFIVVLQLPALAKLFNWNFTWEIFLASIVNGEPLIVSVILVMSGLILLYLSYVLSCRCYIKRDI